MPGLELTALFNRHLNAEDARTTVEHIRPNSIVFGEGYMAVPLYARQVAYGALEQAASRLINGEYEERVVATPGKTIPRSPDISSAPFNEYSQTLKALLRAKNCAVIPADYVELGNIPAFVNPYIIGRQVLDDFFARPGLDKVPAAVEASTAKVACIIASTALRETAAADRVLEVQEALNTSNYRGIALTDTGDFQAYSIYGAAHYHSLVKRFRARGIVVSNVIRVHDPEETESGDIDALEQDFTSDEFEEALTLGYIDLVTASLQARITEHPATPAAHQ